MAIVFEASTGRAKALGDSSKRWIAASVDEVVTVKLSADATTAVAVEVDGKALDSRAIVKPASPTSVDVTPFKKFGLRACVIKLVPEGDGADAMQLVVRRRGVVQAASAITIVGALYAFVRLAWLLSRPAPTGLH